MDKYKKRREEVIELYKAGAPIEWISQEVKVDKHLVYIWIGRYKLGKPLELRRGKGVREGS